MEPEEILKHLASEEAVLTDKHFVYTSGAHGSAYINMRQVAHQPLFLEQLGIALARRLIPVEAEIVAGPETLGRTLASYTAGSLGLEAVWCDVLEGEDGIKFATFSNKMNFGRLLKGKRVAIVDDLLTSGSSIRLTAKAVRAAGGIVVGAAAVVRRTPDVNCVACSVPELIVLAEVEGFALFSEAECAVEGPCSRRVPMVLRPGHGWKWIESHPDYPTAN